MKFVLGFCFDVKGRLAMVCKQKGPKILHGKWNGIGGKCDPGEGGDVAIYREWPEETGLSNPEWVYCGRFMGDAYEVLVYKGQLLSLEGLPSVNDVGETMMVVDLNVLDDNVVAPNLVYILPMVLANVRNFEVFE